MPTKKMCAACTRPACDRSAVVFRQIPSIPDMSQAETVVLPGRYCAAAGQVRLLHELRMHPEFIGGELRAFAEKRAEKDAEKRSLFGS